MRFVAFLHVDYEPLADPLQDELEEEAPQAASAAG